MSKKQSSLRLGPTITMSGFKTVTRAIIDHASLKNSVIVIILSKTNVIFIPEGGPWPANLLATVKKFNTALTQDTSNLNLPTIAKDNPMVMR